MQTRPVPPGSRSQFLPLLLLGLGLVMIGVAAFFLIRDTQVQNDFSTVPLAVNYSAPVLTLMDIGGIPHSLADYRGQVVLVNLWATWCPPCKEEMPTLEAFYQKYKEKDFVIIAINDGDPKEKVLQFVKDYKLTFPVWLDPTYQSTETAFKTLNLPSSFVIDRQGVVRLQWVGGISRKMLERYIPRIVEE